MARAALDWAGGPYACECDPGPGSPTFPSTAVLGLVWGLFEERGSRAFEVLRGRIVHEGEPTPACRETVKVGAKRFAPAGSAIPDRGEGVATVALPAWPSAPEAHFGTSVPPVLGVDPDAQRHARAHLFRYSSERATATPAENEPPRWARARPVHALLVDGRGNPLLAASNSGAVNKIRHAEMNLLLGWWGRHRAPFPEGALLYVTLKPCRMCAAFLVRAQTGAGAPPVPVRYLEDDPGPYARNTALDGLEDRHGRPVSVLVG